MDSFENAQHKNLDPELQKLVKDNEQNKVGRSAAIFTDDKGKTLVDITAKLKTPEEPVDGLNITTRIGDIITGTVDVNDILKVRQDENVISLKSARRVDPTLNFSVNHINATALVLKPVQDTYGSPINGEGVILGTVDFGCDFNHRNFINGDGSTRVLYLWDQTGGRTSLSPQPYNYGREFNSTMINNAIKETSPYGFLRYSPGGRAHGTHVMDIACGNGRSTKNPGVAPKADIIFVQLNANDFGSEESFGNSVQLIEAVKYIFDKGDALNKPAVVNLSLETYGGPHDGTTHAEQAFDRLLNEKTGRSIVIAAGNSFTNQCHTNGVLKASEKSVIDWKIPSGIPQIEEHEMEIWYKETQTLDCTLISPNNQKVAARLDNSKELRHNGQVVARLIHWRSDPTNNDNVIDLIFYDSIVRGRWQVELTNTSNDPLEYHGWIERFDPAQSSFETASDANYTIGSIACGKDTIVIGSYDATVPGRDLSFFSSAGPTRDKRQKPEVSAPGHNILAANSTTQLTTRMSGTSMAAPHVTGVIALLMQVGGKGLSNFTIRKLMIDSVNKDVAEQYNNRYGNGRVDSLKALSLLLDKQNAGARPVISGVSINGNHYYQDLEELLDSIVKSARNNNGTVNVNIEIN